MDLLEKLKSDKKISKILFYFGCHSWDDEQDELFESATMEDFYGRISCVDFHTRIYNPSEHFIKMLIENYNLFKDTLSAVILEGEYDEDERLLEEEEN